MGHSASLKYDKLPVYCLDMFRVYNEQTILLTVELHLTYVLSGQGRAVPFTQS